MSSKDKIVPITSGETKPKQGSFALIVGPTQVESVSKQQSRFGGDLQLWFS